MASYLTGPEYVTVICHRCGNDNDETDERCTDCDAILGEDDRDQDFDPASLEPIPAGRI